MRALLFILIFAVSGQTWAKEDKSVVFPSVSLQSLSEATIKAVKAEIDATLHRWELVREIGSPTLLTISQGEDRSSTVYELELEVEMKSPSDNFRIESVCLVELDSSLKVLYASCEGYEPEPWD